MSHYVDPDKVGFAVVIPGYGHANWGDTASGNVWAIERPVALYCGNRDAFNSDFICFDALLSLNNFSTKIDIVSGVIDSGALTAEIPATGEAIGPEGLTGAAIVEIDPSSIFTQRVKEAAGLLATEFLGKNDTIIDLWSRDGNQFSAYQTIYLEDETIVLGTQLTVSGEVQTFQCYRGCYGSRAAVHQAKPVAGSRPDPLNGWDNRIYTQFDPFGKPVYVVERIPEYVDVSNPTAETFEITWRGWMTRNFSTSENASKVSVTLMDLFSPFFGRQLNREPHGASWDGQYFRGGRVFEGQSANGQLNLEANEVSRTYGPAARRSSPRVVVQLGEGLVSAQFFESTGTDPDTGEFVQGFSYVVGPSIGGTYTPPGTSTPLVFGEEISTVLMNSPVPDWESDGKNEKGEEVHEVLVGGTAMVDLSGVNYSSIYTSSEYLHHPLVCLLPFVLSTGRGDNHNKRADGYNFDSLSLKCGMGIPTEFVDVASIYAEVLATPDQKTYGWCLGYGGSTFNWGDIRGLFLTPYRRFVHPNANFQLDVSNLEPVLSTDVDFTFNASDIEMYSEEENYGFDEQIQSLGATAALPWEKGKQIQVRDVAQGVKPYDPDVKDPEFDLNVSALRPIDRRGNGEKRDAAEAVLEWKRRPMPTRMFSAAVLGWPRPHVGSKASVYIDVVTPWKDNTGAPLAIGTTLYGIIEEVGHDFGTTWYTIALRDTNDPFVETPHKVARSFKIAEVIDMGTGSHRLRCTDNQHGETYLTDNTDLIEDFIGEDIEVWDMATGLPVNLYTTGDNITATVSNTALDMGTLGNQFDLIVLTPDDTLPVAGQYIRLSRRSNAEDPWEDTFFQTYLSDDAEVFSDGDRARVYV